MRDEKFVGKIIFNNEYQVVSMNESAKRILGFIPSLKHYHKAGSILEGDIVAIVDRIFGDDDGGLTQEDLIKSFSVKRSILGFNDQKRVTVEKFRQVDIKYKDLLFVGVFKKEILDFKFNSNVYDKENLRVGVHDGQLNLDLGIDYYNKLLKIRVTSHRFGTEEFNMPYVNSFGHMVVLDGETGKVKFYQDRGYTRRNESIRELIYGASFSAKVSPDSLDNAKLVGLNLDELFCNDTQNSDNRLSHELSSEQTITRAKEFFGYYNARVFNMYYQYDHGVHVLKFIDYEYLEQFLRDLQSTKEFMERKYIYNQKLVEYGDKLLLDQDIHCGILKSNSDERRFTYKKRPVQQCLSIVEPYKLIFINNTNDVIAKRFMITKYALGSDIEINDYSEEQNFALDTIETNLTGFVKKSTWNQSQINIFENFDKLSYEFRRNLMRKIVEGLCHGQNKKVFVLSSSFMDLQDYAQILTPLEQQNSILDMSFREV